MLNIGLIPNYTLKYTASQSENSLIFTNLPAKIHKLYYIHGDGMAYLFVDGGDGETYFYAGGTLGITIPSGTVNIIPVSWTTQVEILPRIACEDWYWSFSIGMEDINLSGDRLVNINNVTNNSGQLTNNKFACSKGKAEITLGIDSPPGYSSQITGWNLWVAEPKEETLNFNPGYQDYMRSSTDDSAVYKNLSNMENKETTVSCEITVEGEGTNVLGFFFDKKPGTKG